MSNQSMAITDYPPFGSGVWSDVHGWSSSVIWSINSGFAPPVVIQLTENDVIPIEEAKELVRLGRQSKTEENIRIENQGLMQLWVEYQTMLALVKDEECNES